MPLKGIQGKEKPIKSYAKNKNNNKKQIDQQKSK